MSIYRSLAFHQCGPGSIPGLGVISGLSLLVLYSAPRGFSPGTPVFPSPQKLTFDLIWFDLCWVESSWFELLWFKKGIPSIGITSGISCSWYRCLHWSERIKYYYINMQNKNQTWSEGKTKNNKQKIYIQQGSNTCSLQAFVQPSAKILGLFRIFLRRFAARKK